MAKKCSSCDKQLPDATRFCTSCGSGSFQVIVPTQLCACGKEVPERKKFCPSCGRGILKAEVPNKTVNISPVSLPESRKQKSKKSLILFSAIIVAAFIASYFIFFYTPPVKKILLASFHITPNDTTETIIQHGKEISLIIPKGQIKTSDTLNLYSVKNLKKHELSEKIIRTYDFDFQHTKEFSEKVLVVFNYEEEQFGKNHVPYVMYYNEETGEWMDTEAVIDRDEKTITVYRSSFSCLGLVSQTTEPGPMMKVLAMNHPSKADSPPQYKQAEKILSDFIEYEEPTEDSRKAGYDLFMKSYEVGTLATSVHEDILKHTTFQSFNKLAGRLGLLRSTITFTTELSKDNYVEPIMNITKDLVMFKLGALGWKAVVIYNISSFLYNLHQDHANAKEQAKIETRYLNQYNEFNAGQNHHKRTKEQWTAFILDNIEKYIDFEWALNIEIEKYLNAYFEVHTDVPSAIKYNLIERERINVMNTMKAAIDDYFAEARKRQEQEVIDDLNEMKKLMNTVIQLRVSVHSSDYSIEKLQKRTRNLPVRIIVGQDQHLWEGKTDQGGQWWFNFTWLGFLHYGAPSVVELEYNGQRFSQTFEIDNFNVANIRFILPDDEEITEADKPYPYADFSTPFGLYTGSIHGFLQKGSKGTVEINVDKNLNVTFHAELTVITESEDINSKGRQEVVFSGSGLFEKQPNNKYYCHTVIIMVTTIYREKQHEWDLEPTVFIHEVEALFPLWYYDGTISGFGEYHDYNITMPSYIIANKR